MRTRLGLLLLLALAATPAAANNGASVSTGALDRNLAQALIAPGVATRLSTAVAVELPSGEVVYARNAGLPLQPASNEKLCVTYTALVDLGPQYRYPTEVLAEGHRSGSTWRGSLVLKGFGDPSLTSAGLERLVSILWREGIRKVTGHIVGDASYFDGKQTAPGWLRSFAGLESPPLSALVVDRADVDGQLSWNPPLSAVSELDELLHRHGIQAGTALTGVAEPSAVVLATIYSDPLSQIIEFMDHVSDNFTAEMLLKTLGAQETGLGTSAAGALVVREALRAAGVPLAGVRIADGSGLSRWDRVTGSELAALLVAIWDNPHVRPVVLGALPVAGESGTLEDRMTTAPGRGVVRAKTGTTDIASALSGFVGSRYAFVTIENGDPVNWNDARDTQDRFAEALALQVARG